MSEPISLHEEEVLGKAYDARLIRRLLGYLGPYRLRAAGAVGLIILSSLLELVGPLATAVALDLFIRPLGGEAKLTGLSLWLSERLASGGIGCTPARVMNIGFETRKLFVDGWERPAAQLGGAGASAVMAASRARLRVALRTFAWIRPVASPKS